MQSVSNYKHITDIQFPVYGITNNYKKIWEEDKVLYIETNTGVYVLDNKNLVGSSVGKRRLLLTFNSNKYIPRVTITNISQLVNCNHKVFMDNNGSIFLYKKTKTVPLKYYSVKKIVRSEDGDCIVTFNNIDYPVRLTCREAYRLNCIGLLHTDIGYIIYEYSDTGKWNTWRKI